MFTYTTLQVGDWWAMAEIFDICNPLAKLAIRLTCMSASMADLECHYDNLLGNFVFAFQLRHCRFSLVKRVYGEHRIRLSITKAKKLTMLIQDTELEEVSSDSE